MAKVPFSLFALMFGLGVSSAHATRVEVQEL